MAVPASTRISYSRTSSLGRLDENQEGPFREAMLVKTRAASNCRSGRLMSCRTHEKVRKRLLPQSPPELVGGARELRCERIKKRCAQDTPKCLKTTSAYPEKGVPQITYHTALCS